MNTTSTSFDAPIFALSESPTNPRKHYDQHSLEELASSIASVGVLSPLLVRADPTGYEVIDGSRRYRAAKLAKLMTVPVREVDFTDQQVLEVQFIANCQRENVHPMDEATGYRYLLSQAGYTVKDLAEKVGKDESYVYRRLKLTDLIPAAQEAFWAETLTHGMAASLCRLQVSEQGSALEQITREWGGITTARQLDEWIQNHILLDLHAAPFRKDDSELLPAAGTCDACPKRTGFAPALFPEVKKQDTCTDPTCFKAKTAAHVERKKAELLAKDPETVLVSGDWRPSEKSAVPDRSRYSEITAKEAKANPDAKKALVVEGRDAGRTIHVLFDKRGGAGLTETPAEKAKKKQQRAAEKLATEIQRRQVGAVLAEVPILLGPLMLQFIAERIWQRAWNDLKRVVLKRRGVEAIEIGALTEQQTAALLVEIAIGEYSGYGAENLTTVAELLGIDLKAVAKAASEEAEMKSGKTTICHGDGCVKRIPASKKYCSEHETIQPTGETKKRKPGTKSVKPATKPAKRKTVKKAAVKKRKGK